MVSDILWNVHFTTFWRHCAAMLKSLEHWTKSVHLNTLGKGQIPPICHSRPDLGFALSFLAWEHGKNKLNMHCKKCIVMKFGTKAIGLGYPICQKRAPALASNTFQRLSNLDSLEHSYLHHPEEFCQKNPLWSQIKYKHHQWTPLLHV